MNPADAGVTMLATNPNGVWQLQRDEKGAWSSNQSLAGKAVTCVAVDPNDRQVIYAGTHGTGVLRTEDGGRTWRQAGMSGLIIKSLAVSPHAVGTVYAGTKPANVYVSRNGGETWDQLTGFSKVRRWFWYSPAEPPDTRPYVMGLAVSPTRPGVIFAGIEAGGVVRSVDDGHTWHGHCRGADRDCHDLTFHATDGDWVYQAGGGGPAYSRDGGETWQGPRRGLHGRYSSACAADPTEPEVWYASVAPLVVLPRFWKMPRAHYPGDAHGGIYRHNGTDGWRRLTGGLPQPLDFTAYALVTDRDAPGHLYAGLGNGEVWHSADHGDAWIRLPVTVPGGIRTMKLA